MKDKNKISKSSFMLVIGMISIMIASASVNAERINEVVEPIPEDIVVEEVDSEDQGDLVIAPGPEEPLVISPNPNLISEQTDITDNLVIAGDTTDKSEIKDIGLYGFAIIVVIAGILASVIIIKGKNKK